MDSKKLFERTWNSVYKIIIGETEIKHKFDFMYGNPSTALANKDKITIDFCDSSVFGEGSFGKTLGRTGYLNGKPRLLQLVDLKNINETQYYFSDYAHNYAHEEVHMALSNFNKNTNDSINVNCEMINENMADIISDLGLHTFDKTYANGLSINEMLRTPYKKWEINSGKYKSAYGATADIVKLMIIAFQNDYIDYNYLCEQKKIGMCMPIRNEEGVLINDFLYGIAFDKLHIENTWNNYMVNEIPYNQFLEKCNKLFETCNTYDVNQKDQETRMLDVMKDIAKFANIKNQVNIRNRYVSNESIEKLRTDFNVLWNGIFIELENNIKKDTSDGPNFDD